MRKRRKMLSNQKNNDNRRTLPVQKIDAGDRTGSADRRVPELQKSHSRPLTLKDDVFLLFKDNVLLVFIALILLACILIFLVVLPISCWQTLTDIGAFLARATARATGEVDFVSSSLQYYSNSDGGTVVVKCYEVIRFQPATGRPVLLIYNYYPDLRIHCDNEGDHLTVLYNPRNPNNDARVARAVYDDRTTAIIGEIAWEVAVIGALLLWPRVWRKYRQKRGQGQTLRDLWLKDLQDAKKRP